MKTLAQFDYDLWAIEENGQKKYFARVKSTRVETEISIEVMRVLMNEEKTMRRRQNTEAVNGAVLSLDAIASLENDDEPSWMEDRTQDVVADVTIRVMEEDFIKALTDKQKAIYIACIKSGNTSGRYAQISGATRQAVEKSIFQIREKAKKYFG